MQQRPLGPFTVSAIGLGCMNLSHAYGQPPSLRVAEKLLWRALDLGITHFDTAALYGFGANEELLGRVLRQERDRYTLASKCGMTGVNGQRIIDGRPATLKRTCEEALRRLKTEVIDLYYLHRWDKQVPIEDSVGMLATLITEGKIRSIGLSEVSAATLRRAQQVHPIAAVQSEYSLWTRNPEIAVLAACRELGVSFVAFSPLGRGFLAAALTDPADVQAFDTKDIRRSMPRFQGEAFAANLQLLADYCALAEAAGYTPAQLALAWLLAQGNDILPIPGTTHVAHLEDNAAAAYRPLAPALTAQLATLFNPHAVSGSRYNAATQAEIDTEEFPPPH